MNLFDLAPGWLALVFAMLLVAAAAEDAVRMKISNWITILVLAAGIVAGILAGPTTGVLQNLSCVAAILLFGTFAFTAGKIGGGDVKLLAAVAAWADWKTGVTLISAVFIAGGLLALLLILTRRRRDRGDAGRRTGWKLPYGVAIAGGSLATLLFVRGWL